MSVAAAWRWTRRVVFSNWVIAVLLVGSAMAMTEVDRLIAQCLSSAGLSFTMAGATGPALQTDAWMAWLSATPSPAPLIRLHVAIDAVFAACYIAIAWRLLSVPAGYPEGRTGPQWQRWLERLTRWLVVGTLAMEYAEGGLSLANAASPTDAPVRIEEAASILKFATLALALGLGLANPRVRAWWRRWVADWAKALYHHRIPVIAVGALAVFALLPRGDVFDQYPDTVRGWWDNPADFVMQGALPYGVLAYTVWLLARQRTAAIEWQPSDAPGFPAYWLWATPPIAAALTAAALLIYGAATGTGLVDGLKLALFLAVALLPLMVSLVPDLRRHRSAPVGDDPGSRSGYQDQIPRIRRAGDLVAGVVVGVFGLGLVRAFTGPAAASGLATDGVAQSLTPQVGGFAALIVAGVVIAAAGPKLIALAVRPAVARLRDHPMSGVRGTIARTALGVRGLVLAPRVGRRIVRMVLLGLGVAIIAAFAVAPLPLARLLDAAGTIVVLLIAWHLVVGATAGELMEHPPLAAFRAMRLRHDPFLVLGAIAALALSQVPSAAALHPLSSTGQPAAPTERPAVAGAFAAWNAQSGDCARSVTTAAGAAWAKPLLLVAAQGGGIRAAAWTTRTLDAIRASGACGPEAVFASGGASGGSVGLVIEQGLAAGSTGFQGVKALSTSAALPVDVSGVLANDLLAASTGLRIPSDGYLSGSAEQWQDRAAHAAWEWRAAVPSLADEWTTSAARPADTGWLELAVTPVGYPCRAVLGQLAVPGEVDSLTPCLQSGATARPGTIDVTGLLGDCAPQLDRASAALLSARFPVVSPAARTGSVPCPSPLPDVQLADGGVDENSGLGPLTELAPALLQEVRLWNATPGAGTEAHPYVVPLTAYLSNDLDAEATSPLASVRTEIAVAGWVSAAAQLEGKPDVWLGRLTDAIAQPCSADDATCSAVASQLWSSVGDGAAVVAPRTLPSIALPLGWTLSGFAFDTIDDEVASQLTEPSTTRWPSGYGTLRTLVATLQPSA